VGLLRREGDAVEAGGEGGELVGDEGEERRDDDRDLRREARRQLVRERFAAARREHEQRRLAAADSLHGGELPRAEVAQPEDVAQRAVEQRVDGGGVRVVGGGGGRLERANAPQPCRLDEQRLIRFAPRR